MLELNLESFSHKFTKPHTEKSTPGRESTVSEPERIKF